MMVIFWKIFLIKILHGRINIKKNQCVFTHMCVYFVMNGIIISVELRLFVEISPIIKQYFLKSVEMSLTRKPIIYEIEI